jgi:glycosyltransferase involved in cell wall biosynthesis
MTPEIDPSQRPQRILMVSLYTPPWTFAGAGNQAVLLGSALRRQGLLVTLITSAPLIGLGQGWSADWWETEMRDGLPIVKLQSHANTLLRCVWFQVLSVLWWCAHAREFEVIHIHGCTHLTTVIWALLGQLWHKPVLYKITCDGVDDLATIGQTKGWLGNMALAVMRRCQGFIALTPVLSQKLATLVPASRIIQMTNGVDTRYFKPVTNTAEKRALRRQLDLPQDVPLLIYTGGITPRKNLGFLVEALAEVHKTQAQTMLVIVGPCKAKNREYRGQVQDQIEALGLNAFVQWVDEVPYLELAPYLMVSDVFVFASIQEGQPSSPLEALACGLPVVVMNYTTDAESYVNTQHPNLFLCHAREAFVAQVNACLSRAVVLSTPTDFEPSVQSIGAVYVQQIYPGLTRLS